MLTVKSAVTNLTDFAPARSSADDGVIADRLTLRPGDSIVPEIVIEFPVTGTPLIGKRSAVNKLAIIAKFTWLALNVHAVSTLTIITFELLAGTIIKGGQLYPHH